MLKFIFYASGLFAVLFELWAIFNYDKINRFNKKVKTTDTKVLKKVVTPSEGLFLMLMYGYFIWEFIGLFSSQWIVFLAMMLLAFITMGIRKIFNEKTFFWDVIDSIISVSLIVFAILNTYHLHIPVQDKVFNFFLGN